MKNKLDNIEEVFQNTFDGFEANVDPSVWSNVSNAINGGLASSGAAASATLAKTVAFKIAAGILAVSTIVTAAYFITKDKEVESASITRVEEVSLKNTVEEHEVVAVDIHKELQPQIAKNNKPEAVLLEEARDFKTSENRSKESSAIENNATNNQQDENSSPVLAPEVEETSVGESNSADSSPVKKDEKSNQKKVEEEVFDVHILATITEGFAPLEVEFNVSGNVVSTSWDFKDGETSHQKNAFHTFNKPGRYLVTVEVLDKNNRDKKVTRTIIVKSNFPSSLDPIQRIITPNGDYQNDEFKIRGENIEKLEVFILDRSGKVVNSLKTVDAVWDGTDQSGKLVIPGTYYASGLAIGKDGKSHKIKSAINVLK